MSAWGRTGRVTVVLPHGYHYWSDVRVDGVTAGRIGAPVTGEKGWSTERGDARDRLPSRDAAVLWVLRRVDPALWREERGAWLVRKRKPGEGVQRGWIDGEAHGYNDFWPWLVVDPSGVSVDAASDIPRAHYYANLYASKVAAVTR